MRGEIKMMENINMNEELNEATVIEMACEEVAKSSGKGLGKVVVGLGVAVGTVLGAVAIYKNKDKLTEKKIKKLEKKGYIVIKKDNADVEETVNEDEEIES